jgi:hypothetical protein
MAIGSPAADAIQLPAALKSSSQVSSVPLDMLRVQDLSMADVRLPAPSLDGGLLAAIYNHLKDRSSDELLAILLREGLDKWSPEALAVARQLLRERAAGQAAEPTPSTPIFVPPRSLGAAMIQFLVELGFLMIAVLLGVGLAWALTQWTGELFTGVCFGLPVGLGVGGVLRRLLRGCFRCGEVCYSE